MPPRATWKGYIKLSLVSVPVKAYTVGVSSAQIQLNQLHEECHSRIKYQKTCPIHGEVSNDQIVSGYEYAKGQYVVVDPSELDKLRSEVDKAINIDVFVRPDAVDPVYHSGKTYYLVPDGPVGQKPYALLHRTMVQQERHAVARVVFSGREQLVTLRPLNGLVAMSCLLYEHQVKKPATFEDEITRPELSEEEVRLATMLVEASSTEELDLSQYKDTYTERLTELIEAKIAGKQIVAAPAVQEPEVINLMQALKDSVASAQQGEAKKGKPRKKMATAPAKKAATRKRKKA